MEIISLPSIEEARRKSRNKIDIVYADLIIPEEIKSFAVGKTYYIRTYGCQANMRDEETFAGILETIGFKRNLDYETSDVIILNTCAVRENAEKKVFGEIGALKKIKEKNPNVCLVIAGCMPQEPKVIDKISESYKHIDLIIGTHEIKNLVNLLYSVCIKKKKIVDVSSFEGEVVESLPAKRNDPKKAFVNIMYGCDKFCTYCIVPYTRGRERSRLVKDILEECKSLVDDGYQEITLLGQNVNAYGKDLKDGSNFANLLEEVAKLGIPRLRFITSHPWDFEESMIDVIAKYSNIMKYIHLPFQSGNDEILRLMGRRYTSEEYLNLIKKIKNRIPNIALSTDIIVGFPNETYEEFLDTIKIVKEVKFDSVFTFIYSPRAGTPASQIKDNVSNADKHLRFNELVKECEAIIEKKAKAMIGKTYLVLVEGASKKRSDVLAGYTEENKLVNFKGPKTLIGEIIKVKITESRTYSLIGELADE